MHYVIYSGSGNMLEVFEDPAEARRTLDEVVRREPEAREHVTVVVYDADGNPTGEVILPEDPTTPFSTVRVHGGTNIVDFGSASIRGFVPNATRYVSGPADLRETGPWEPASTEAPQVAIRP